MNRRDTVLALLAISAAPLNAKAQPAARPFRIAWLGAQSPELSGGIIDGIFKTALRELGYVEGKNYVFEIRWAFGRTERFPDLVKELVALKPDVIVVVGSAGARAAQQATATIPIVGVSMGDPVGRGLVKSLSRPGGNLTGLTAIADDISPKRLELLLAVVPKLSRVAVLWNSFGADLKNIQSAAQSAGVNIISIEARTPAEIEDAFARMTRERVGAVIVAVANLFVLQRHQIAELAIKSRILSVFGYSHHVEFGGLMSYGGDLNDQFRRAAVYVDKILKGAKPGDLPIEQSTTFELVINLKTARAIGVTIPQSVLLRADRVIE